MRHTVIGPNGHGETSDGWVPVATAASEFEANLLVARLHEAEIPASVVSTGTMGSSLEPAARPDGAIVVVPRDRAADARRLATEALEVPVPAGLDDDAAGLEGESLERARRARRHPLAAWIGLVVAAAVLILGLLGVVAALVVE